MDGFETGQVGAGLVVLGAGRGSAELLELFVDADAGASPVVLDDRWPDTPPAIAGAPIVGRIERAQELLTRGGRLACGVANARRLEIRSALFARVGAPESAWSTLVHPAATVLRSARLGAGCVLYPGVRVGSDAQLGRMCVVYFNSVLHHDAQVGEGSMICAGVLVAGGARIGRGCYLGIGAVVRDGVQIGDGALVGMGAVVTRDVRAGAVVTGVPARARE
jgi:sugar O-acyltransferase (sialic acid O-acetyltransferase NeuD family)